MHACMCQHVSLLTITYAYVCLHDYLRLSMCDYVNNCVYRMNVKCYACAYARIHACMNVWMHLRQQSIDVCIMYTCTIMHIRMYNYIIYAWLCASVCTQLLVWHAWRKVLRAWVLNSVGWPRAATIGLMPWAIRRYKTVLGVKKDLGAAEHRWALWKAWVIICHHGSPE